MSKHHLARYLARRGHRVLYVEAPLGPLTLARRRVGALEELRAALPGPRQVEQRVWAVRHFNPVPYHAVTPLTASVAANRFGQRLLLPVLRRQMRALGTAAPVLIAGLPHAVDLVPTLPRSLLVYHCADDYANVRGFPRTLPVLEERLCRQADLVVATSEPLAETRRIWNSNTHWIPNGVDLQHLARTVEPDAEVASLPKPVVGFVGALAEWVDIRLLRRIALAHPEWSLALVGPVGTDISAIQGLPNVHLLGARPYGAVPSLLAAMDAALIPFKDDAVTRNADPIKAYEYLAAGLPVVATDLPALRRLGHVVRLAASHEAFLEALEAVVAAGRSAGLAERQHEAQRHSWDARFERFETLVEEALQR